MNIAVCVKQVVDTEAVLKLDPDSWRLDRSVTNILNPYDEYAVEEALLLREAHGGEVTAVCMGPEGATEAVRKALAMGADKAILVSDAALEGSDVQGTAYVLAEALKTLEWDLVLFGVRSTDGETGCVPAVVGELLGVPVLSTLAKVEVDGAKVTANRETETGYIRYECQTPAVLSVIKGINEPRFPSMKGIMTAKTKPIDTRDVAALSLDAGKVGQEGAKTRVLSGRSPEPRKAGEKIEDDGTGAVKIAEYLASKKLV